MKGSTFLRIPAPITVLDHRLAAKLGRALYPANPDERGTSFTADWPLENGIPVSYVDHPIVEVKLYSLISALIFLTGPLFREYYSSATLGRTSRPPFGAVVLDLIDLAIYLARIDPSTAPKPVSEWLHDFLRFHPNLRSLDSTQPLDDQWVVRGYLSDLFRIIAGGRASVLGLDWNKSSTSAWADNATFPGPSALLGAPPIDASSVPDGPIEELDAAFICSGPFKIRLTSRLENNLQLNTIRRELLVYWEADVTATLYHYVRFRPPFPSIGHLQQFTKGHILARFVAC